MGVEKMALFQFRNLDKKPPKKNLTAVGKADIVVSVAARADQSTQYLVSAKNEQLVSLVFPRLGFQSTNSSMVAP
jgi:hypothetical protein